VPLAKVLHNSQDKISLLNETLELANDYKIKNLIVIIENTDGEVKTGFNTQNFYDEIGLLELAKQDALKHRDI
jgi:hypothetical protein